MISYSYIVYNPLNYTTVQILKTFFFFFFIKVTFDQQGCFYLIKLFNMSFIPVRAKLNFQQPLLKFSRDTFYPGLFYELKVQITAFIWNVFI